MNWTVSAEAAATVAADGDSGTVWSVVGFQTDVEKSAVIG